MFKGKDAKSRRYFEKQNPYGQNGFAELSFLSAFASLRLIIVVVFAVSACSVPNLESPACTESKNAVREFYSHHFGSEMKFTPESLRSLERFLTPEFRQTVSAAKEGTDPFTTGSDDFPKAFRVGECREITNERTESSVLIFWRTDERTEQREIKVETVDRNDTWLVNNISR